MSEKWTTEQRDIAFHQVQGHTDEPVVDASYYVAIAVDLQCQRNELLEALKEMTAIMHQLGHKDTVCVLDARAAIAKAEDR